MPNPAPQKAPEIEINLLAEEAATGGTARFLNWALTGGRLLLIGTELLLLVALSSRFFLDGSLSDLKEGISSKKTALESQKGFESDFRALQARLALIKRLKADNPSYFSLINKFLVTLPSDTTLTTLKISKTTVDFSGTIKSASGLQALIETAEKDESPLGNIQITKLAAPSEKTPYFDFSAKADLKANAFKKVERL
ncbi:MAG: hypothetical protein A2Y57_02690 [Candidatus Woykebacteria bacterium RBG_13_40_7b]|uniref:PilN domain-containing protein n=1 Tax=Candidatus Woykebacteria bacterium RBG_13_40_7b TaxID=1802594 RepID=A0A1G1WBI2_9BACT|nr:MAG: hypothetical protein A2Y57_02690 [Candidatus Woykebacteria bacterium RBG_13_40_7b]